MRQDTVDRVRLIRAQRHAFHCGIADGRKLHIDGWANHSPSYRAGQAMARVEADLHQHGGKGA